MHSYLPLWSPEYNLLKVREQNRRIYRHYSPQFEACTAPAMIRKIEDLDSAVDWLLSDFYEKMSYFRGQCVTELIRIQVVNFLIPKIYSEETVNFEKLGSLALDSLLSFDHGDQELRRKLRTVRLKCIEIYSQLNPNILWYDHANYQLCEEFVDGVNSARFHKMLYCLIERYAHPNFERYLSNDIYELYWKKVKNESLKTEWDYLAIAFNHPHFPLKLIMEMLRPEKNCGITALEYNPFPFVRNLKLEEFDACMLESGNQRASLFEYLDCFFTAKESIEKITKFLPQCPAIVCYISQNKSLLDLCIEHQIDLIKVNREQFFKRGVSFAGLRYFNTFYPEREELSKILEEVVRRRSGVRRTGGNFTTYQVCPVEKEEKEALVTWMEADDRRLPIFNILDLLLSYDEAWELFDRNLESHPELVNEVPWLKEKETKERENRIFNLDLVTEILRCHPGTFPYVLDSLEVHQSQNKITFEEMLTWYDQYLSTLSEKKRKNNVIEGKFSAAKSASYHEANQIIPFRPHTTDYEQKVLYKNALEMKMIIDRYYSNYVASLQRSERDLPKESVRLRHFFRSVFASQKILSKLIEMPNLSLTSLSELISYTYGEENWMKQIEHSEQIENPVEKSYAKQVVTKRKIELQFFNEFSDAKRKHRLPELFEKYEQYGDALTEAVFSTKTLDQKQKRSLLEIIKQREIYLQLAKMEEIVDEMLLKKCTISEVLKSRNIPVEEFYKAYHASKEVNEQRYHYVKDALKENKVRGFKKLMAFGYVIYASPWNNLDEFQEQFPNTDLRSISFRLQNTAIGQDLQVRYQQARETEPKEETFLRELGMKKSLPRTYLTRAIQLTEQDKKLEILAKEFTRPMQDLYQEMYSALTETFSESFPSAEKNNMKDCVIDFASTSARYLKDQKETDMSSKKVTFQYIKARNDQK